MLPPIPQSLVPTMASQDVAKPRPDIPAVTPAQESSKESSVELERRHPQEAQELLEQERRRRKHQRQQYTPEELAQMDEDELAQKSLEALPRQGLWVDVEI